MTFSGQIKDGKIVLDGNAVLPEGAKVEVYVLRSRRDGPFEPNPELLKYAGIADDLPPDASSTVDRVLYGRPPE